MGTHTETYRRFAGTLRRLPLRFHPLMVSGIRVACRRKLPLALLYALPAVWTVIFSFHVYTKYALETGKAVAVPAGLQRNLAVMAAASIDVRNQIVVFFTLSRLFAVLVIAWFGAGLLAEDRRRGANLLYFSRPLTRLDYLLGRFFTLFFFGALATLVPGLVICTTAVFSSPEWLFLREEGEVIWGTLAYGAVVTTVLCLITLTVSSLSTRRAFALAGTFGAVLVPDAVARVVQVLERESDFRMISPLSNFSRIGYWLLDQERWLDWEVWKSFAILGGMAVACAATLLWRVRRWERAA